MASTLPVLSGREIVRTFENLVWQFKTQNDSRIMLYFRSHREATKVTLRGFIRTYGLSV